MIFIQRMEDILVRLIGGKQEANNEIPFILLREAARGDRSALGHNYQFQINSSKHRNSYMRNPKFLEMEKICSVVLNIFYSS